MLRPGSGGTAGGNSRAHTRSGPGNHRLAGADGALINRSARSRRAGRLGNARTRRRRRGRHRRTRSAEFSHQICPRRHYRTGRRLPGERSHSRQSRRTRAGCRWRAPRWRGCSGCSARANVRTRPLDYRRARGRTRHGRTRSGSTHAWAQRRRTLRERLPWTGKNLSWPRTLRRQSRQGFGARGCGPARRNHRCRRHGRGRWGRSLCCGQGWHGGRRGNRCCRWRRGRLCGSHPRRFRARRRDGADRRMHGPSRQGRTDGRCRARCGPRLFDGRLRSSR
jgi:hypothetical protein